MLPGGEADRGEIARRKVLANLLSTEAEKRVVGGPILEPKLKLAALVPPSSSRSSRCRCKEVRRAITEAAGGHCHRSLYLILRAGFAGTILEPEGSPGRRNVEAAVTAQTEAHRIAPPRPSRVSGRGSVGSSTGWRKL